MVRSHWSLSFVKKLTMFEVSSTGEPCGVAVPKEYSNTAHNAFLKEVDMLVLSRKLNDQVVIDGNIVVTVVEVRGGTIKLGIECPREIPVHRGEVHQRIINEEIPQRNRPPRFRGMRRTMEAMVPIES